MAFVDQALAQQIKEIVDRVNTEPGSAIPILQAVQNTIGYVSKEMIDEIATNAGIPASDLYGIATFYSQFHMEPRGKNIVKVCHGTACHLLGADRVAAAVEMATGAKEGHTSSDRVFSHERVACLGCCSLGPVIMVNDEVHAAVKPERVATLLRKYRQSKSDSEVKASAASQPSA